MGILNYLLEFDIESEVPELDIIEDLDITDKTILQEQINQTRKSHKKLIDFYDSLQNDIIKVRSKLASKKQSFYIKFQNRNERIDALAQDTEILELQNTIEALLDAMKTVNNHIDFVKNDLAILKNSMYNKF